MVVNRLFWKNKKVLVTGHTGFKGGWLCLLLEKLGAEITGYSLQPKDHLCLYSAANISSGVHSVMGDICDLDHLRRVFSKEQPEIVIHLAAQSLVGYSYEHPMETYSTNVLGTVNILQVIRESNSVRSALMITTDKCYENKERDHGYKESDRLGGYDPYSSSKACAEIAISSFRNSYFGSETRSVGVASARAGNVIGGGDWSKGRLIPDIVRSIGEKQEIVLRNPDAIRPWQHVLDPLAGYLVLLEKLYLEPNKFSSAWNFGPRTNGFATVSRVVNGLVQIMDAETKIVEEENVGFHETQILKLDCYKSNKYLDWYPRWDLSMAIEKTANWYVECQNKSDMREYCFSQIDEFVAGQ